MAARDRSASLPALFVARQQRVDPEVDPELGRAPARGRRNSRRPSMLDALVRVPKASIDIPAAAPGPESPEHAWEALCHKARQLAKPDLDANPPRSIEDIRRAALTEWVTTREKATFSGSCICDDVRVSPRVIRDVECAHLERGVVGLHTFGVVHVDCAAGHVDLKRGMPTLAKPLDEI